MICTYLTIRYIWSFSDGDGDEHTLYFIHINVYNKNWVRKAIHIYIVRVASGVAVFVVFRYICYFVFSFFLFCSEAIKKKSFGFVGAFCSTFPECEDEKELHADKKGANEKKIFIIYNLIYIFICWKQRTGIKWCYISRLTLCCCCFFIFTAKMGDWCAECSTQFQSNRNRFYSHRILLQQSKCFFKPPPIYILNISLAVLLSPWASTASHRIAPPNNLLDDDGRTLQFSIQYICIYQDAIFD